MRQIGERSLNLELRPLRLTDQRTADVFSDHEHQHVKHVVPVMTARGQASRGRPGQLRVALPQLLGDDLVQRDVKHRVDLPTADGHRRSLKGQGPPELRVLSLD